MRPVFLQQFDHDAVCGLGMEESNESVDALTRGFVDETDAFGAELLQSLGNVGDGEADVVAAFAATRQEAGGAALFICGGEEFDGGAAGIEKCDFDSVVGRVEAFEDGEAEDAAVGGEGVVEVMDDDADVVYLGVGELHGFPFRLTLRNFLCRPEALGPPVTRHISR